MLKKQLALILIVISYVSINYGEDFYYKKVKLDGKYKIVGRYQINREKAKKTSCYDFIYNETGKLIKVQYLENGNLNIDPYFGCAIITIEYSEGYETHIFKDVNGKPMKNEKGVYSVRLKLDKNGNPILLQNLDNNGKLMEDIDGVSQYKWILDDKGRRIISFRLNKQGEQITDKNGVYEISWKYNDKDEIIESWYYGTNGQLVEDKNGITIIRWKYDNSGNIIEISYYGINGKLKNRKDWGIAKIIWEYNKTGELKIAKFFGENGQPQKHNLWDSNVMFFK